MTWRWPSTAETCRHRQTNKLDILRQLCFDGPTHPYLHKTQRGWWTWRLTLLGTNRTFPLSYVRLVDPSQPLTGAYTEAYGLTRNSGMCKCIKICCLSLLQRQCIYTPHILLPIIATKTCGTETLQNCL